MFEALGTKLLGRRVGRRRVGQTRVGQTRFLIWIWSLNLDSGFWGFGFWKGYGHMVGSKMVSLENTTFQP